MSNCKGCETKGKEPHNDECAFEHFLSYTGFAELPVDARDSLKMAYMHGARDAREEHPAIPEDVRSNVEWMISPYFDKCAPPASRDGIARATALRDWLSKCQQASDKAVCPKCGKDDKSIVYVCNWCGKNFSQPREPKVTPKLECDVCGKYVIGCQCKGIKPRDCPTCEGLGEVPSGVEEFGQQEISRCQDCMGTGRIPAREPKVTP